MGKNDPSALWEKVLPDGRLITLNEMLFDKIRLNIAPRIGAFVYDDSY